MQFLAIIGGVVLFTNLDAVAGRTGFTGAVLADIYPRQDQELERQGDHRPEPRFQAADGPITVVRRSDGSGTTFVFVDYLPKHRRNGRPKSALAPQSPGQRAWAARATKAWRLVCATNQGAIGYVEYAYAKKNKLTTSS